jgi:hypothetical protein
MPLFVEDYARRLAEWRKAAANTSQLLINCLETIDASLWLIAAHRLAQALVLLHNAIETALKSELERIHGVLIADRSKLDYAALKSLLKEAFMAHPRGKSLQIHDFDLEKTISFTEALDRVAELYPFISSWRQRIMGTTRTEGLHGLRNAIVHYGSDRGQMSEYARTIATIAFPFLDQLLRESADVSLANVVTPKVYRELDIARTVCQRLEQEQNKIESYVLNTVSAQVLHTFADWRPELVDDDVITEVDLDRELKMVERMRRRLASEWADAIIEKECQVCECNNLFVKIDPVTEPRRTLHVLAAQCPKCGLEIGEDERFLAEYHVGALSEAEIEATLKDCGL